MGKQPLPLSAAQSNPQIRKHSLNYTASDYIYLPKCQDELLQYPSADKQEEKSGSLFYLLGDAWYERASHPE